eukprot:gene24102-30405_t
MQKTSTGTKEGGLWSRLRQDIAPPPVIETARPVSPRGTSSGPYVRPTYNDDGQEERSSGQSDFRARKTTFNNAPKTAGSARRPAGPSSSSSSASAGYEGGGGRGAGSQRREKKRLEEEEAYLRGERREGDDDEDEEDEDVERDNVKLDPEDMDLVFDSVKETEDMRNGRRDYTVGDMDELDVWLANVYMESMKADDGMCIEMASQNNPKKIKLPKPRSMSQMAYSMKSNIRGAEMGSAGYALGEQAWSVVNKNMYYNEGEKYQLVDLIAKYQNDVNGYVANHNEIRKVEDEPYPPCTYDGIFEVGFKRGIDYIEEEEYRKSIRVVVQVDNPYNQAPTDWSVEAVEDEDQL